MISKEKPSLMKVKILKILESNARITVEDIAKELGLSVDQVSTCIGELETDHVICGYDAIINWDAVDVEKVNALIEVRVIPQRGTGFDTIANRIAKFDEVDSVYLLSGGYDFMVQINGKSMKEVSQFVFNKLSAMDAIQSTSTHFVLKKYKDHGISLCEEPTDDREMDLI